MNSLRENILQEAATKNQEFESTSKSLNSFLDKLPTNQINSNDDLSQIAAKQSSQEVRQTPGHTESVMWRILQGALSFLSEKTENPLFSLSVSDLLILIYMFCPM